VGPAYIHALSRHSISTFTESDPEVWTSATGKTSSLQPVEYKPTRRRIKKRGHFVLRLVTLKVIHQIGTTCA